MNLIKQNGGVVGCLCGAVQVVKEVSVLFQTLKEEMVQLGGIVYSKQIDTHNLNIKTLSF